MVCGFLRCLLAALVVVDAYRLGGGSCLIFIFVTVTEVYVHGCMPVCMFICMHACMPVCMFICMHACMHVCM